MAGKAVGDIVEVIVGEAEGGTVGEGEFFS
jgi:hypothetical protein